MKMTKIAVVVVGLCAGTAFAQDFSAKLYGTLDAALGNANNQATTNSSPLKFVNSGDSTSVLGVLGSKKLANGMTAGFELQGAVSASDGSSTLFTRLANFSVTTGAGKFSAGLQVDPAFGAYAATDPRGISNNNSGLGPWIMSSQLTNGGGTANTNTSVNIFNKNSMQYAGNFGGLGVTVAFGPGNSANGSGNNSTTSLGLVYAGGPLVVSAATSQNKLNAVTAIPGAAEDSSVVNFGAAYTMGQWRFALNSLDFKTSSGAAEYQTTGLGANYAMSNVLSFNLAYYATKDKPNGGALTTTTAGLYYTVDKAVTVYAQLGMTKEDATGFGGAAASTGAWSIDAGQGGTGSGFVASPGNTVQTLYVGTKVSF
jgi:hypothetical protein